MAEVGDIGVTGEILWEVLYAAPSTLGDHTREEQDR